jgi:putative Mn2+ efflux pump MntP
MKLIEILLLTVGISFDSFAIMTCKGAMLPKINKARLMIIGLIFGGWQALVLLLSNYILMNYLYDINIFSKLMGLGKLVELIAVFIFCGLGIYMIGKALRNKIIYEKREEYFLLQEIFILAVVTSIDALLTGIGMALLKINLLNSLIPIVLINFLSVILGVYTGYFYGYEQKTKAYTVGGAMLVGAGIRILLKQVLYVI